MEIWKSKNSIIIIARICTKTSDERIMGWSILIHSCTLV
jgi:hypothetical protein